jgi:hypothetical protein
MDNDKSREILQQLQDEINKLDEVDEQGSELLKDIDGHIRQILEHSGESPLDVHPNLAKRLDDALRHFEATHPTLTALISEALDTLSTAGV